MSPSKTETDISNYVRNDVVHLLIKQHTAGAKTDKIRQKP